jgi:hypothetical protein
MKKKREKAVDWKKERKGNIPAKELRAAVP